jgi:hypothetical protein
VNTIETGGEAPREREKQHPHSEKHQIAHDQRSLIPKQVAAEAIEGGLT